MKTIITFCLILLVQAAKAQRVHSGISGRSVLFACIGLPGGSICGTNPLPTTICIYNEQGRLVREIATDDQAEFRVHLQPGSYHLVPLPHPPYMAPGPVVTSPVDVVVT